MSHSFDFGVPKEENHQNLPVVPTQCSDLFDPTTISASLLILAVNFNSEVDFSLNAAVVAEAQMVDSSNNSATQDIAAFNSIATVKPIVAVLITTVHQGGMNINFNGVKRKRGRSNTYGPTTGAISSSPVPITPHGAPVVPTSTFTYATPTTTSVTPCGAFFSNHDPSVAYHMPPFSHSGYRYATHSTQAASSAFYRMRGNFKIYSPNVPHTRTAKVFSRCIIPMFPKFIFQFSNV